ncbi:MAG: hypothetical protein ACLP2H_03140 [Terriglobales bacterium]
MWLLEMLQNVETENVALHVMLEQRGVRRKELRKELAQLQETSAVKRRSRAATAAIRKSVIAFASDLQTQQMLEEWKPPGKPH